MSLLDVSSFSQTAISKLERRKDLKIDSGGFEVKLYKIPFTNNYIELIP